MCHVVATCDCVCKRLRHPLPCNISYILHAGLSFVNNWQCQHIAACTAPSTTQPILLVYMTHAAYVSQCMQWLSFSVPIPPSVSSLTKLNSQLVGPAVIHHPAYYSASTPCSNGAGPVLLQPEHTPAWPATKHNGKLLHFSSRPPSMWSVRLPPPTHTHPNGPFSSHTHTNQAASSSCMEVTTRKPWPSGSGLLPGRTTSTARHPAAAAACGVHTSCRHTR